jgi:molybdenum cofactor sulfurtransferase
MHAHAARQTVLYFFDCSPNEYVCIFTKDAKEALNLVAESYPFSTRSSLVLPMDSSTSLMGVRGWAHSSEAEIVYLDALDQGGFNEYDLRVLSHVRFSTISLLTCSGRRQLLNARSDMHPTSLSLRYLGNLMPLGIDQA